MVSLTTTNCLALMINTLILLMFWRFRRRLFLNTNNILLCSMSVADFCVGITGNLVGILFYLQKINLTTKTFYKLCGILPFFGSFFMSILSLGIMTADRLISVKTPLRYSTVMTERKIKLLILTAWITVILILLTQATLYLSVSPLLEIRVRAFLLVILFLTGGIILTVSNASLYVTLRKRSRKSLPMGSFTSEIYPKRRSTISSEASRHGRKERRLYRESAGRNTICILMTLLFVVCWCPVSVYYFLWLLNGKAPLSRVFLAACLSLAACNSFLNPCIYLLKRKDFRYHMKQLVCRGSYNSDFYR